MKRYSLSHLSDDSLLRGLVALVAQDRATTADLLAHIAEVDERKLHLRAGYPSMFAYCIGELGLSEDAAAKRIQVARLARRIPAILEAVSSGRLHLSGVVLLAPYLVDGASTGLLEAAAGKSKAQIERLLAERFPKPDMLSWVASMPSEGGPEADEHAPGHVDHTQVVAKSEPIPAPLAPERIVDRPRVTAFFSVLRPAGDA